MHWSDSAVQSAVISAAGSLVSTVIAAICAAVIGKRFTDRKKLEEKLFAAQHDIAFLLAVEEAHCDLHIVKGSDSNKLRVRESVYARGFTWSKRFTPGRVRDSNFSRQMQRQTQSAS